MEQQTQSEVSKLCKINSSSNGLCLDQYVNKYPEIALKEWKMLVEIIGVL